MGRHSFCISFEITKNLALPPKGIGIGGIELDSLLKDSLCFCISLELVKNKTLAILRVSKGGIKQDGLLKST